MTLSLPFRLSAGFVFLFLSLIASPAHAAGSLSREDFLAAIGDPRMREYVAEHFQLAEDGRALRAGRQMPNAGERIPPFEIVARSNDRDEAPLVLRLSVSRGSQVLAIPCPASILFDPNCQ